MKTPEEEQKEIWNGCNHGSTHKIVDPCPSCGSHSLFIGMGGHLTCSVIGCKDPGVTRAITAERNRAESLVGALKDIANGMIPKVPNLNSSENFNNTMWVWSQEKAQEALAAYEKGEGC